MADASMHALPVQGDTPIFTPVLPFLGQFLPIHAYTACCSEHNSNAESNAAITKTA